MKRLRALLLPPRRPLRWALPLAVLAGLVLLQGLAPQWAGRVEAWTVDARFQLRGPESPRYPIVLVAVDEDSVQSLGGLAGQNVRAWPRASWAELVTKIAAGRPRLIVLDVVFDTPGGDPGGDDAPAAAMAAAGNVVLAANWDQRETGAQVWRTLSPPRPVLAQAAAGQGIVNFPLDADGAVRRLTLLYPYGGKSYPALAPVVAGWQDGVSDGLWLVPLDGSAPTVVPGTAALKPSRAVWSPSPSGWPLLFDIYTGPQKDIPVLYSARGDGTDPVEIAPSLSAPPSGRRTGRLPPWLNCTAPCPT